jgi:MbtH protein
MDTAQTGDKTIYKVVVNNEGMYSIWPADRENGFGWTDVGKTGTKKECLAYLEEVKMDFQPMRQRKNMQ